MSIDCMQTRLSFPDAADLMFLSSAAPPTGFFLSIDWQIEAGVFRPRVSDGAVSCRVRMLQDTRDQLIVCYRIISQTTGGEFLSCHVRINQHAKPVHVHG